MEGLQHQLELAKHKNERLESALTIKAAELEAAIASNEALAAAIASKEAVIRVLRDELKKAEAAAKRELERAQRAEQALKIARAGSGSGEHPVALVVVTGARCRAFDGASQHARARPLGAEDMSIGSQ